MQIHLLFDLLAYSFAFLTGWYSRKFIDTTAYPISKNLKIKYSFVLLNGVIFGSILFGTLNLYISGHEHFLGKSIIGAIVGGIIAAELFKRFHQISGSTGAIFVPALCVGIIIGRLGCYFAGLDDFTFGIKTDVAWAVDFGDGVKRHPVQLYESFTTAVFLIFYLVLILRKNHSWTLYGFYGFCFFYGLQRGIWEFLKPYDAIILDLNLFHFLCLFLIFYSLYMLNKQYRIQS